MGTQTKYDVKRFTLCGSGSKYVQCVIWGIQEIKRFSNEIQEGNVSILVFVDFFWIFHFIFVFFFQKLYIENAQSKMIATKYYHKNRGAVRQEIHIVQGTNITNYGKPIENIEKIKSSAKKVNFDTIADTEGLIGKISQICIFSCFIYKNNNCNVF